MKLLPKREEKLYVATKTIQSTVGHSLRPRIVRGEVVPSTDPRVQQHPQAMTLDRYGHLMTAHVSEAAARYDPLVAAISQIGAT